MSLQKYIERVKFMDWLIRRSATGNAEVLAQKLNLSISATEKFIHEMKDVGFPISYCKKRKSYFYHRQGKMVDTLFTEEIENDELKKITGGKNFFSLVTDRNYSTV